MKIPTTLKIGATQFEVRVVDSWAGSDSADGETLMTKKEGNVIFISSQLSKERAEWVLIHEALHAMNTTIDHVALDSLSNQLYQFLRDNRLLA